MALPIYHHQPLIYREWEDMRPAFGIYVQPVELFESNFKSLCKNRGEDLSDFDKFFPSLASAVVTGTSLDRANRCVLYGDYFAYKVKTPELGKVDFLFTHATYSSLLQVATRWSKINQKDLNRAISNDQRLADQMRLLFALKDLGKCPALKVKSQSYSGTQKDAEALIYPLIAPIQNNGGSRLFLSAIQLSVG